MEHPATTHRRTLALVSQYRKGDREAQAALLTEAMSSEFNVAATISSLLAVLSRVLDERPEHPDEWLENGMLVLAALEGQEPPTIA